MSELVVPIVPPAEAVSFATLTELEEYLTRSIPEAKQAGALRHLAGATSKIQDETRQTLALVLDDEVELTAESLDDRGCLHLPERPVLEASSITIDGVASSGFEAWRNGQVHWMLGPYRMSAPIVSTSKIVVVYSHGYALSADDIPEENPLGIELLPQDVKDITLELAASSFLNPEAMKQESIGQSWSGTYQDPGLTRQQRRRLKRYRKRVLA